MAAVLLADRLEGGPNVGGGVVPECVALAEEILEVVRADLDLLSAGTLLGRWALAGEPAGLCCLVRRYSSDSLGDVDGLPGGEGTFLPCSFRLADNLVLQGRTEEGRCLLERLAGLANDVGLLAEEYDVARRRTVGNFPQAFSHVGLVNTAHNLSEQPARPDPAARRPECEP